MGFFYHHTDFNPFKLESMTAIAFLFSLSRLGRMIPGMREGTVPPPFFFGGAQEPYLL